MAKPAERAKAMARQIAALTPDLVALQEASVVDWDGPHAGKVDLLDLLRNELKRLRRPYELVGEHKGLDISAPTGCLKGQPQGPPCPPGEGFNVHLKRRIAILARADIPSELKWSPPAARDFATLKPFTSPAGVPITVTRGWIYVDESVYKPIFLVKGGFKDAWAVNLPGDKGPTCCRSNIKMLESPLRSRADLILYRGDITALDARRVGIYPDDRAPSDSWPSDHAGVLARLQIYPANALPAKAPPTASAAPKPGGRPAPQATKVPAKGTVRFNVRGVEIVGRAGMPAPPSAPSPSPPQAGTQPAPQATVVPAQGTVTFNVRGIEIVGRGQ